MAAIQHEPRVAQHVVRVSHTDSPASRDHTTGDDSFSRVHQMGLHTTHERRHRPHPRNSYDPRVPSASRDRVQTIPQQQHAGINNKASRADARVNRTSLAARINEQVHSALLGASIRPERPSHNRHMAPTTRIHSSLTNEPSLTLTSGLSRDEKAVSEANDDIENYLVSIFILLVFKANGMCCLNALMC